MLKSELIERSPLRTLEKSIHGGVGVGNIGLITSKPGVGKTACLVHLAIDQLLQDKHVIHLSFSQRTDHIIDWYESIFLGIAQRRNLENTATIHDSIVQNRVIMNFNQKAEEISPILKSIEALMHSGRFNADILIIDGFDFQLAGSEILQALRAYAQENNLVIWASADLESGKPLEETSGIIHEISVLVHLQNHEGHINIRVVKDHEHAVENAEQLSLDPDTLLISV